MTKPADRDYPLETTSHPRTSLPIWRRAATGAAVLALALAAASSMLFVDETEYVIVENLGRIAAVYDNTDPQTGDRGLHFKLPWPFAIVRRFDRRQQIFDPPGREMFTRDKKNITTTAYVCWKIAETGAGAETPLADRPVVKFFRSLGNTALAESRLDARVRSILSTEIGRLELADLLGAANSEAGPGNASPVAALAQRTLQHVRQRKGETESIRSRFGIDVVDLRLRRINLPEGNRFAVYERMRTERERISESYRSAGRAERTRIESQARRQSEDLLSRAEADSERIRGEGEAEAIAILNRAHAEDPEFYEFQRTLVTYGMILNERTTLVLSASSGLLRLLTEGIPDALSSSSNPPSAKPPASKPVTAQPNPAVPLPTKPAALPGAMP